MPVTIPITADTTGFVGGIDRAENSMNRLLNSHKSVERNLVGLATQLSTARTGTDVLAIAAERLTHVFKSGLEIGVTVGLLGVVYEQANKATDAFMELEEGIRKALSTPTGGTRSTDSLIEGMKKVTEESDKLTKSVSDNSFFANIQRGIMAVIAGGPTKLGTELANQNQLLNKKNDIFSGQITDNGEFETKKLRLSGKGESGEHELRLLENSEKYNERITQIQDVQKQLHTDKLNPLIKELELQKAISEQNIIQAQFKKNDIAFSKIYEREQMVNLEKRASAGGRKIDAIDTLRLKISSLDDMKKSIGPNITLEESVDLDLQKKEALEKTRKEIMEHSGSLIQGVADSSAAIGGGGNFSAGGFAADPMQREQLDALKNIETAIYQTARNAVMTVTQ